MEFTTVGGQKHCRRWRVQFNKHVLALVVGLIWLHSTEVIEDAEGLMKPSTVFQYKPQINDDLKNEVMLSKGCLYIHAWMRNITVIWS